MVLYEKLPLERALDETPQIASLVKVYDSEARDFGRYVEGLHQISSQLVSLHNKLTTTYQDLAKHLKSHSPSHCGKSPSDEMVGNLRKFSDVVFEMSSWQHIMAAQIADGVVYPLSKFLDSDIGELSSLSSSYQTTSNEVTRTIGRYSRIKKADPQQEKHEATEELFEARKKHHQVSLLYYSRLNQVQYSQQMLLLQPILGLITASRSHHNLGAEFLASESTDQFMSSTGMVLKSIEESFRSDISETDSLMHSILTQSQLLYYPQPPGDLAQMPPDTSLTKKEGYLNVHRKYMGVMSTWENQFVFIEGGNILGVPKSEVAGCLLLELEPSTLSHAADTDGRLHVFTVVSSKKSITLQALNDRERDEWMVTIERLAQEGGYIREQKLSPSSSIFHDVGQYLVDKLQSAAFATTSQGSPTHGSEPTPVKEQIYDIIPADLPIIFDLLNSGSDEEPPKINLEFLADDDCVHEFDVRFLGCMKVKVDTGQTVVFEVMNRILNARSAHMINTSEFKLKVTPASLSIIDPKESDVVLQHELKDVAFWAAHPDIVKLIGYIVRQEGTAKQASFSCYIFEGDTASAKSVCVALGQAARKAYDRMLDKATSVQKRKGEATLLLANIAQLPDMSEPPEVTDGFLILNDQHINPVYSHTSQMRNKDQQRTKHLELESDA